MERETPAGAEEEKKKKNIVCHDKYFGTRKVTGKIKADRPFVFHIRPFFPTEKKKEKKQNKREANRKETRKI